MAAEFIYWSATKVYTSGRECARRRRIPRVVCLSLFTSHHLPGYARSLHESDGHPRRSPTAPNWTISRGGPRGKVRGCAAHLKRLAPHAEHCEPSPRTAPSQPAGAPTRLRSIPTCAADAARSASACAADAERSSAARVSDAKCACLVFSSCGPAPRWAPAIAPAAAATPSATGRRSLF
jgi:hypothetical protein